MPKKLKNQNRRNSLNMFEFLGYFDDKKKYYLMILSGLDDSYEIVGF